MTRIHLTGQNNWHPRNPSGLTREQRDGPLNPTLWQRIKSRRGDDASIGKGTALLFALCLLLIGAAAIIGPVFEPVPDTYSTQGAGGSNVPGSE